MTALSACAGSVVLSGRIALLRSAMASFIGTSGLILACSPAAAASWDQAQLAGDLQGGDVVDAAYEYAVREPVHLLGVLLGGVLRVRRTVQHQELLGRGLLQLGEALHHGRLALDDLDELLR